MSTPPHSQTQPWGKVTFHRNLKVRDPDSIFQHFNISKRITANNKNIWHSSKTCNCALHFSLFYILFKHLHIETLTLNVSCIAVFLISSGVGAYLALVVSGSDKAETSIKHFPIRSAIGESWRGGWRQALLSAADAGAPLHFLFQPDFPLQILVFVHIQLTFRHFQIYQALFSGAGGGSLAFHFSPRPSVFWRTCHPIVFHCIFINFWLKYLFLEDLFSSG